MLITNRNYAKHMDRLAQHPGPWIIDYETTGLHTWLGARIISAAVGPLDGSIPDAYFPYGHSSGNLSSPLDDLLDLIFKRRWIAHNVKFEYQMSLVEGYDALKSEHSPICTLVGLHVVNENRPTNALKPSCQMLFGADHPTVVADTKLNQLLQDRMLDKGQLDRLTAKETHDYGIGDIGGTRDIFNYIVKISKHEDTMAVWEATSRYACVVSRMEARGVRVDLERVAALRRRSERRCLELLREARVLRRRPINLDSPRAVGKWLGIPSTRDDMLEQLDTPEAKVVREFRTHSKAVSSYYKPFQQKAVDGILHCSFRMDGTVSGRLSCSNPNLQAIPRDDEVFGIKSCILAREGMVLLHSDYSQAEVRLVAHYSGDDNLIKMVNAGGDTHAYVANEIGVPRPVGKQLNFSVIYGISGWTLGQRLQTSEEQANVFLTKYHTQYPGFRKVYDTAEKLARKHRFITMWSRRRRHYNRGPFETPYHKASSNLIQGGVGELLRERQTLVHDELSGAGVEQVLQIHDAAAMEVPKEDAHVLAPAVKEVMEDHKRFRAAFTVDVAWGDNLTCKEGEL
jgi:DNA polymerase-1